MTENPNDAVETETADQTEHADAGSDSDAAENDV